MKNGEVRDYAHRLTPELVVDELTRVGSHYHFFLDRLKQLWVVTDLQQHEGQALSHLSFGWKFHGKSHQ
jgi:hypothetical protein